MYQTLHGDPAHPDLAHRAIETAIEAGRFEPIPDDFWDIDIDGDS